MACIVRSVTEYGSITYHCPSLRAALAKLQDFQRAEYRDITVTGADDQLISEDQLVALVDPEVERQVRT